MNDLGKLIDEIAVDLWHRFRAIALAIDQAQRFVAMPSGGEPATEQELWLKNLPNQAQEIEEIAKDLVLRAFRTALEPTNYFILQKLKQEPWVSYSDLMETTGLTILPLSERVNDLIQVGLVMKDVQTGQVQATKAAQGLVALLEEVQKSLSQKMSEKVQHLRNKDQQ